MTPTPWHVGKKYPSDVYSKSETLIGGTLVARSTIDDAAHIVKCVNCHDDLLEALKLCAAVCAGETMHKMGLIEALEQARAAIAKATA